MMDSFLGFNHRISYLFKAVISVPILDSKLSDAIGQRLYSTFGGTVLSIFFITGPSRSSSRSLSDSMVLVMLARSFLSQ